MQFILKMGRALAVASALALMFASSAFAQGPSTSAASVPRSVLVQPADLVKALAAKDKPLVLAIGPHMLFTQGHIAGSEYVGAGSTPDGIAKLRQRVKALAKSKRIVLYCGCCPWEHCPNVAPAFNELRLQGFTNVQVLYIANNLGADWVYKGFPTEKGE